jgi:hypothetical protein
LRPASSWGCAPAGPISHSSSSTSRSRGKFAGSSYGTIASPRPGGGSPLARVVVCKLRRLIFKPAAASSACCGFQPEPVIEFDFHRAGRGQFRRQCFRKSPERLFRRRSGSVWHPPRRRHLESRESLQCCRGRQHPHRLWRLRKCNYREFHDFRTGYERPAISFRQPGCRYTKRRESPASAHRLCEDGFGFRFRRSFW